MVYEETIINEALHYQTRIGGDWLPMTAQRLTAMVLEARAALAHSSSPVQPRAGLPIPPNGG